jgi:hypothetical protein
VDTVTAIELALAGITVVGSYFVGSAKGKAAVIELSAEDSRTLAAAPDATTDDLKVAVVKLESELAEAHDTLRTFGQHRFQKLSDDDPVPVCTLAVGYGDVRYNCTCGLNDTVEKLQVYKEPVK